MVSAAPKPGGIPIPRANGVRFMGSVGENEVFETESANHACNRDVGFGTMAVTEAANGKSRLHRDYRYKALIQPTLRNTRRILCFPLDLTRGELKS